MIPSVPRTADEEDSEEYIGRIDQVRITLSVRNATPDHILRELARLGNMDVEVLLDEGDHPAYKITYRK